MDAGQEEDFILTKMEVTPMTSAVADAVTLSFEFEVKKVIKQGTWTPKFIIDASAKRRILEFYTTAGKEYQPGSYKEELKIDQVDVSGAKKSELLNTGLFVVSFKDGEDIVADINMVTMMMPEGDGINKTIISPLE
mmetsp:Transcript_28733/g.32850  ORF Transcript_28733/g.32850 Transcript_28733/m.32850 type:complete len:136 (+) Transcript_28733:65-472(+)